MYVLFRVLKVQRMGDVELYATIKIDLIRILNLIKNTAPPPMSTISTMKQNQLVKWLFGMSELPIGISEICFVCSFTECI